MDRIRYMVSVGESELESFNSLEKAKAFYKTCLKKDIDEAITSGINDINLWNTQTTLSKIVIDGDDFEDVDGDFFDDYYSRERISPFNRVIEELEGEYNMNLSS